MQKRGQIAVFVIIGIVLLILIALIFVGRKEFGFGISKIVFLKNKIDPLQKNIQDCVDKSIDTNGKLFAKQGGDFGPSRYVLYENIKVKYLCYNIQNSNKCINMMPTFETMTEQLSKKINDDVNNCINKDLFKSGLSYDVITNGELETEIQTIGDSVKVIVKYDVTLSKDESEQKLGNVEKEIELPLKELYDVTFDVVNNHAGTGFFDQLLYMLEKKGKYEINVDKSPSLGNVGDIIYKINKKNSNFEFWFAIEGE